jgi:hypothetical protein
MKLKSAQKIMLGRIIIIIMSLFGCMFLLGMLGGLFRHPSDLKQKIAEISGYLFTLGLVYFPLRFGIRLYKHGKRELSYHSMDLEPGTVIQVESNINQKEHFKFQMMLVYSNPFVQYMTFLGLSFLILQLVQGQYEYYAFQTSFGVFALVFPLLLFIQSKQAYQSNPYLREKIHYSITKDQIITQGETFYNAISLTSLYKVKELKHWFLLYNSNQTLIIIPKKGFKSAEDQFTFRNFITSTVEIQKDLSAPSTSA